MSYILDALKRADAQRERGAVPGLHTRQVTPAPFQATHRVPYRFWPVLATILALGAMAAGLWIWQTPPASAVRLAAVEPDIPRPPVPMPLPQPIPAPAPATPAPPVPPAPLAALPPIPLPAVVAPGPAASLQPMPAAAPKPVSKPVSKPVAKPALATPAAAMQTPPKPRPDPAGKASGQGAPAAPATLLSLPPAKASAPPQAGPAAVPLLSELSESLRRQIPALTITGSVYSKNPAQRLLLVNNQVLSQGALAAPEVNLEEIRAKSSVFSFRGTRFQLAH
ncbi:MAG: general secretion pathway protein GspB [Pseudomonadota bacterium]|nr:general secretion pathway protein GspB [Pseudomonadota bacterium]